MTARIFRPARSAMQSGTGQSRQWVLEYGPSTPRHLDPLMGWTSSDDTQSQIRLCFESRDEAVAYAETNGIPYAITASSDRKHVVRPRGYGENFAFERREAWTH